MKKNNNGQKFILIEHGEKSKREVIEEYMNFSITSKNSKAKQDDLNFLDCLANDKNYTVLYRKQAFYHSQKVKHGGKLRKPIFISKIVRWESREKKIPIKEANGEWGIMKLYRLADDFVVELKPYPHLQLETIKKEFYLVSTALKKFNELLNSNNPFNQ